MKTTLNEIRKYEPCAEGWKKLLTSLGKTEADDEPLSIDTIIDSNGLDDALWCLRAVEGKDREIRMYAVWCARQVQHLLKDKRSLDAIDVAERYANGEASRSELNAARVAAEDAVEAARDAAGAAYAADTAAARSAAWVAARYAEGAARSAAAWAATEDTTGTGTVWAARSARIAAEAAAWTDAAWAAAEATRAKQEAELRRICGEVEG